MSDYRFYDVAVCWFEGGEPHATFHHTVASGCASLAIWRFIKHRLSRIDSGSNDNRLTVMEEIFLGQYKWDCSWCGEDQHACECEVDEDGLVWVNGSVGVPFEDSDLPF